jgi:hypothetical protein
MKEGGRGVRVGSREVWDVCRNDWMRRNVGGEGGVVRLGSVEGGLGKGGKIEERRGRHPRSSWK